MYRELQKQGSRQSSGTGGPQAWCQRLPPGGTAIHSSGFLSPQSPIELLEFLHHSYIPGSGREEETERLDLFFKGCRVFTTLTKYRRQLNLY